MSYDKIIFIENSIVLQHILIHNIIMFVAPLKDKVVKPYSANFTQEFLDWASSILEDEYKIVTETGDHPKLIFSSENDMTLYLLTWTEEVTYPKYRYSVFYTYYPQSNANIIANEILGVQPMTGSSDSIFSLKSKYL